MLKPIADKAEVAIDFPDKTYMGSFGGGSGFDISADEDGIHLHLERRQGEKRRVSVHIHYHLLADIVRGLAETARSHPSDAEHRRAFAEAVDQLAAALARDPGKRA